MSKRLSPNEKLWKACSSGNLKSLCEALDRGAEIEAREAEGLTPLMLASSNGHKHCVGALLLAGAQFCIADLDGADVAGNADKAALGHRPKKIPLPPSKALLKAARDGNLKGVKSALRDGADVDSKDEHGWTALMWAAMEGRKDCFDALLAAGADIEARDEDGLTALMFSAYWGHKECVALLLSAGADVCAKSDFGNTVFELAKDGETKFLIHSFLESRALSRHIAIKKTEELRPRRRSL